MLKSFKKEKENILEKIMAEIYENLGKLLKDALENGEIERKSTSIDEEMSKEAVTTKGEANAVKEKSEKDDKTLNNTEKTENNSQINKKLYEKIINKAKKSSQSTGKVYKMYKYTENMQFPEEISVALSTLDIAYPFTKEALNKAYRKAVKKYHPDKIESKNTIQNTELVEKLRQKQFLKLQEAYELLKNYFKIE